MKSKRFALGLCVMVALLMTSCGDGTNDSFMGRIYTTVKRWFTGEEHIKIYVENAYDLDMRMVCVDGGTFLMGATMEQADEAKANEFPVHTVTLSTYYIGATEVTQAQWEAVMGTDIYHQRDKSGKSKLYGVGPNHPMYYVSWEEAMEFCRRLSRMTGKCYTLPTEAQWEFAARGGTRSKGYRFSGGMSADSVGWYSGNSDGVIHPVAQKNHNELTLYDMTGNVYEYCRDWVTEYLPHSEIDPIGPAAGYKKVLRGGCYRYGDKYCRIANRGTDFKAERYSTNGFRVVMLPDYVGQLPDESIQLYAIGDYYDDGNKQGVVFAVSDDGLHGKIVSLKQSPSVKQWSIDRGIVVHAEDYYNGAANMAVIKREYDWKRRFPAFAWCASLGREWYLPSYGEMEMLFSVKKNVNTRLSQNGGVPLSKSYYWTSTEDSSETAWYFHTSDNCLHVESKGIKDTYVRAVATF